MIDTISTPHRIHGAITVIESGAVYKDQVYASPTGYKFICAMIDESQELHRQVARLRTVLTYYADKDTYRGYECDNWSAAITDDNGERAREALEEK